MTESFKDHIMNQPQEPVDPMFAVIEQNGREETDAEQDERLEAICAFDTLELQYLAEKA